MTNCLRPLKIEVAITLSIRVPTHINLDQHNKKGIMSVNKKPRTAKIRGFSGFKTVYCLRLSMCF
jgi:hypothetical protein